MARRYRVLTLLGLGLVPRSGLASDPPVAPSSTAAFAPAPTPESDPKQERDKCVDAHARAQEARQDGDLKTARELLRVCSQASCPQAVRADCAPWYDEVERGVPSLVFAASSPRGDETALHVTMDGTLLADGVSGAATDVNPGQHSFHFELSGYPAVDQVLLVHEGEKSRVVYVKFVSPEPAAAAHSAAPALPPSVSPRPLVWTRPVPLASYVLAGTAAVGVAWGSYFGGKALSARSHAEHSCQPICDPDVIHGVRDKALLADVGFGVALLSASASLYLYLTRPTVSREAELALSLGSDARASRLTLSGAF